MRLDLFLKASRLCPRRSIAQEICDAGAVRINGNVSKSGRSVKAGDEIEIRRHTHLLKVRVEQVPASKQVSRADAPTMYSILSDVSTGANEAT